MDEYINRTELTKTFERIMNNRPRDGEFSLEKKCLAILTAVREAPAADVVEVVRCEKCDLWNEWDAHGRRELGNYVCSCAHWSTEDGGICYTKPNDFCSYGEPKDGAK